MKQLRNNWLALIIVTISSAFGYQNGIEIYTESPDVKVYLNDKYIGVSEELFDMNILRIENIKAGFYTLRCELPGFDTQISTIRVKADEILTQYVHFEAQLKSTGTIKILSKPSQAKIVLNGDIKGVSDLTIEDISTGIKRVEIYF